MRSVFQTLLKENQTYISAADIDGEDGLRIAREQWQKASRASALPPPSSKCIVLVFALCPYGLVYSFWLSRSVLAKDVGTASMRAVSDPIREGAEGFLKV